MTNAVYQVDAFTARPFAGNPAGVVPLAAPADEGWMQQLAREMNLSETAFFWPADDGFRLRWFTPRHEVRLCGHATLAAAHVLWETERLSAERAAEFETLSGRLVCQRAGGESIEMDFPAIPGRTVREPHGLTEALGARPAEVRTAGEDLLAVFDHAEQVRRLEPDFRALEGIEARGVCATAPSAHARECDFVSRFFAPRFGIPEDPVTGSSHCALTVYWAERLGKREMTGYQVSARGGKVGVRLAGDRVALAGEAVTVFAGALSAAAAP